MTNKNNVQPLLDLIINIGNNCQALKGAIKEQKDIISNYKKMLKDIAHGGLSDYTTDGLEYGIVQAKLHIEQLTGVRKQERDRIKETQQMIRDIQKAEANIKEALESVVIEVEHIDEG